MDLLQEIRNLRNVIVPGSEHAQGIENPVIRHDQEFWAVHEARLALMRKFGTTWAGILDRAEQVNASLTHRVCELAEEIDSDIYGKYVRGTLTWPELDEFYRKLTEWKELSLKLFDLLNLSG